MIEEVPRTRVEIRRDTVTAAARNLFARHGFHATGIAQIADVSGIKVQQIYRDFCNKEGIVAAIVANDVGMLFTEISQISSQAKCGRGALREWLRTLFLQILSDDHPPLFLEIFAEASRNPRIAMILRTIDVQAHEALIAAFTAFAPPGTEPERLTGIAELFLTMVAGTSHRLVANPELDRERFAEMMCDVIVDRIPQ